MVCVEFVVWCVWCEFVIELILEFPVVEISGGGGGSDDVMYPIDEIGCVIDGGDPIGPISGVLFIGEYGWKWLTPVWAISPAKELGIKSWNKRQKWKTDSMDSWIQDLIDSRTGANCVLIWRYGSSRRRFRSDRLWNDSLFGSHLLFESKGRVFYLPQLRSKWLSAIRLLCPE